MSFQIADSRSSFSLLKVSLSEEWNEDEVAGLLFAIQS